MRPRIGIPGRHDSPPEHYWKWSRMTTEHCIYAQIDPKSANKVDRIMENVKSDRTLVEKVHSDSRMFYLCLNHPKSGKKLTERWKMSKVKWHGTWLEMVQNVSTTLHYAYFGKRLSNSWPNHGQCRIEHCWKWSRMPPEHFIYAYMGQNQSKIWPKHGKCQKWSRIEHFWKWSKISPERCISAFLRQHLSKSWPNHGKCQKSSRIKHCLEMYIWAKIIQKVARTMENVKGQVGSNIAGNGREWPQNIVFMHICAKISQKVDRTIGMSKVKSDRTLLEMVQNGPRTLY